jgi:hypothetical protein
MDRLLKIDNRILRQFRLENAPGKLLTSTPNLGIIQPALSQRALLGQNLVCPARSRALIPNFPMLLRMGFCSKGERRLRWLGAVRMVK